METGLQERRRSLSGCRRCGAGARVCQAPRRCGTRHHRQAPAAAERVQGHEYHRRGRRKTCMLIGDMVDTAGTLCRAAEALKEEGATRVVAYITHPVLSGEAV